MICRFPDGSGRLVAGEDTGQPGLPPGWGVFDATGVQVGKLVATYRAEQGEPYGCAFDGDGRLFTTEVGNQGFGTSLGQLILWFPPYDRFPGPTGARPESDATSGNFCKLATDIGTAGAVAVDADGRVYVASASRGAILRFSPPFPTGPDAAGGCGARGPLGSPAADRVQREVFARGLYTFSGLAFGPDGHLVAASVLTGDIVGFDAHGRIVRRILDPDGWLPPLATGHPQGLAFDAAGSLYFADLDLVWNALAVGPGENGKLRRIRFDAGGRPLPPETLLDHLAFPDGVAVMATDGR
jgi:sugar lactone lactonase YvrE